MEKSNRDDWLKKIQSELKGAELDELDTILPSGLERSPLYVASDSPGPSMCLGLNEAGFGYSQSRNGSRAAQQQIEAEVAGVPRASGFTTTLCCKNHRQAPSWVGHELGRHCLRALS